MTKQSNQKFNCKQSVPLAEESLPRIPNDASLELFANAIGPMQHGQLAMEESTRISARKHTHRPTMLCDSTPQTTFGLD